MSPLRSQPRPPSEQSTVVCRSSQGAANYLVVVFDSLQSGRPTERIPEEDSGAVDRSISGFGEVRNAAAPAVRINSSILLSCRIALRRTAECEPFGSVQEALQCIHSDLGRVHGTRASVEPLGATEDIEDYQ